MLSELLIQEDHTLDLPKEGDLYKEVSVCGKTFRLLYGYYESFERESPFSEPIPIYPDFIKEPCYTSDGIPFVTEMQNVCEFYMGKSDEDSSCSDCVYFQGYAELFGLCTCSQRFRCEKSKKCQGK